MKKRLHVFKCSIKLRSIYVYMKFKNYNSLILFIIIELFYIIIVKLILYKTSITILKLDSCIQFNILFLS